MYNLDIKSDIHIVFSNALRILNKYSKHYKEKGDRILGCSNVQIRYQQ